MARRKIFMFSVPALLVAAGLSGMLTNVARAQIGPADIASQKTSRESTETAGAASDSSFDRNQKYEHLLKMALGACFEEQAEVTPGTEVTIGFTLDAQGQLFGFSERLGEAELTDDTRQLAQAGMIALAKCDPYPSEEAKGRYTVVLSDRGVETLIRESPPPPEVLTPADRIAEISPQDTIQKKAEMALGLDYAQRYEVQRRLQLLGHDPQGVDGKFGQKTRQALAAWQEQEDFPATGYLNDVQLEALNAQSQSEYANYVAGNIRQQAEASRTRQTRQRVKMCRSLGLLNLRVCHYEYR